MRFNGVEIVWKKCLCDFNKLDAIVMSKYNIRKTGLYEQPMGIALDNGKKGQYIRVYIFPKTAKFFTKSCTFTKQDVLRPFIITN